MMQKRSDQEHDLARVLLAIVLTFIICHALRIFLNFYEMIWIRDILDCMTTNPGSEFPIWSYIVNELSTLFMVLNSCGNTIIYCCLNKKFRRYIVLHRQTIYHGLSRRHNTERISTIELHQSRLKRHETMPERTHFPVL